MEKDDDFKAWIATKEQEGFKIAPDAIPLVKMCWSEAFKLGATTKTKTVIKIRNQED